MKKEKTKQLKFERELQSAQYNLIGILQPQIMIDGNKWCVLYGEDLQNGIAGFGDTPNEAVLDFNKQWNKRLNISNQKNNSDFLTTI